jgi:hypothetical protein
MKEKDPFFFVMRMKPDGLPTQALGKHIIMHYNAKFAAVCCCVLCAGEMELDNGGGGPLVYRRVGKKTLCWSTLWIYRYDRLTKTGLGHTHTHTHIEKTQNKTCFRRAWKFYDRPAGRTARNLRRLLPRSIVRTPRNCGGSLVAGGSVGVRKTPCIFCDAIFMLKTIILPRQARDKHRNSTQKERSALFFAGTCCLLATRLSARRRRRSNCLGRKASSAGIAAAQSAQ